MRSADKYYVRLACSVLLTVAFLFSGCSTLKRAAEPAETPQPVNVEPQPVPATPVEVPEPPKLPPIAIVLSGHQPAYADIAAALTTHFEDYVIYDLSDGRRPPVAVLSLINDSDSSAVVAIGLRAARSSVAMSNKPVIFSQVFNYQDHDLLTDNSRGIAALTPLDAQLAAWKEVDPDISRVGAIIGPGHEELITAAEIAAARHNVELRVQVTHSDQETQYIFKRMMHDIDGFWLFPDNRILSRRALQEIMRDAQRQNVSVLVPNESMLQVGATVSVSSVASNIADTIANIVRQIQDGNLKQVPLISPLSEVRVRTNSTVQVVIR